MQKCRDNNIHFNLPALMSDGREYSYYDPSCKANTSLRNSLGIKNHTLAKYVIQIKFQGYSPDGEQTIIDYDWIIPTM